MADHYIEEIEIALENKDQDLAATKALEYLEERNKVSLNIAITGESGSGKSTLVNALRGIRNKTDGAAPTGVKETTMEPTVYLHPELPNIKFWDLPGVGTTKFTSDEYIKKMGFEKYDFFIIVSSDRFTENDAKLAKEIQKMNKKFYFVRSKIDHNIQDEKRDDPNVKEEDVLHIVRKNCTEELQKLGFESPKFFLISSCTLHLHEFNDLWKTLEKELPEHQRDALLLALPNISLDVIEQKKTTLEKNIYLFTVASAVVAVVPFPCLTEDVNLKIVSNFTEQCMHSLGLTPESLQKLSEVSGVSVEHLKASVNAKTKPLIYNFTDTEVQQFVTISAHLIGNIIADNPKHTAVLRTLLSMSYSCVTTYKTLTHTLNSLAEDAQQVFKKATGLNTSVE